MPVPPEPGRAHLGGDGLHLVGDAQVAPEVLASEPGVGLAEVIVVGELLGRADRAGQEAAAQRGEGH